MPYETKEDMKKRKKERKEINSHEIIIGTKEKKKTRENLFARTTSEGRSQGVLISSVRFECECDLKDEKILG